MPAQPPAVRSGGALARREADPAELAAAARRGAWPTGVATVAVLAAGIAALDAGAIQVLARFAFSALPGLSAFAFANGVMLALPAVLPVAMARLMAGRMRAEVARSPAHGRAAAAGASLAVAGTAAVSWVGLFATLGQLRHPGQVMFWLAGLPLGMAMGVGILGALLFREVEAAAGEKARPLPAIYPALVGAGVVGPAALGALFVGGFALSPLLEALAPATPGLGLAAWMVATYACFLPVAYLVPRQVRRAFPRSSTSAVALGVALPGLMYACTDLARIFGRTTGVEQLGLLSLLAVSLGAWVALAFRGAKAGEPGEEAPVLLT